MFPNDKPFIRDNTPNPPQEIVHRLRTVLMPLAALIGIGLTVAALASRRESSLAGAWACGALFVALLLMPKRWRTPPAKSPASTTPSPPPTTQKSVIAPTTLASAPDASSSPRPRVLLLNASLAGAEGNSARLLAALETRLAPHAELRRAQLVGAKGETFATLQPALRTADAFVIATGTHWDSWSSPLQKFLEDATPAEATALWLGKPAAVLVTENSTGGKGVLSRLQGVLVTLGCAIPPLSGLVLSQAAQDARASSASSTSDASAATTSASTEDYWSPDDLAVVAHNLLAAARQPRADWQTWPVDRTDYARVWIDTGSKA